MQREMTELKTEGLSADSLLSPGHCLFRESVNEKNALLWSGATERLPGMCVPEAHRESRNKQSE